MDLSPYAAITYSHEMWKKLLVEKFRTAIHDYMCQLYKDTLHCARSEKDKHMNNRAFHDLVFQKFCVGVKDWSRDELQFEIEKLKLHYSKMESVLDTVLSTTLLIMSMGRTSDRSHISVPRISLADFTHNSYTRCCFTVGFKYPFLFNSIDISGQERMSNHLRAEQLIEESISSTILNMLQPTLEKMFENKHKSERRSRKSSKKEANAKSLTEKNLESFTKHVQQLVHNNDNKGKSKVENDQDIFPEDSISSSSRGEKKNTASARKTSRDEMTTSGKESRRRENSSSKLGKEKLDPMQRTASVSSLNSKAELSDSTVVVDQQRPPSRMSVVSEPPTRIYSRVSSTPDMFDGRTNLDRSISSRIVPIARKIHEREQSSSKEVDRPHVEDNSSFSKRNSDPSISMIGESPQQLFVNEKNTLSGVETNTYYEKKEGSGAVGLTKEILMPDPNPASLEVDDHIASYTLEKPEENLIEEDGIERDHDENSIDYDNELADIDHGDGYTLDAYDQDNKSSMTNLTDRLSDLNWEN